VIADNGDKTKGEIQIDPRCVGSISCLAPLTGGNEVFICERNKDFILKFELVSFR